MSASLLLELDAWAPLNYLTSAGPRAGAVVPLTWASLIVAVLTCAVFTYLVLAGSRRAVARGGAAETVATPLARGPDGVRWIIVSLWLSAVPLAIGVVWTMVALAQTGAFPAARPLAIEVIAHQWWWEIHYVGEGADERVVTANELHIPVGERILVRLASSDVIHSFWVPQLTGKTDLIPGQRNLTWLAADRAGRYRGQCGEYCGAEHGRMQLDVVAEPRAQFEAWRRQQLQSAPPPETDAQRRGLAVIETQCAVCHTVRGTLAASHVGPDLTHLMSRARIAAGVLPNNRGALLGWIQGPQDVKPGARMPNQHLDAGALLDVGAYLETLR